MTGGVKHDADKTRYELLPPEFLEGVAQILTLGAKKYAARNWEKGIVFSRVFGAIMRHLWAWWRGESNDLESGKSHLWHAGCELAFLIAFEARNQKELDDRPHVYQARDDVLLKRAQEVAAGLAPREDVQPIPGWHGGLLDLGTARGFVDRVQIRANPEAIVDPRTRRSFVVAGPLVGPEVR